MAHESHNKKNLRTLNNLSPEIFYFQANSSSLIKKVHEFTEFLF